MDKADEKRMMAIEALSGSAPVALLVTPLDYVFADHFRQRVLCNVLDDVAQSAVPDRELIEAALCFLKADLSLHIIDEEQDLFPLLRRRAEAEDNIGSVLGDLSEAHYADGRDAAQIVAVLDRLLNEQGYILSNDERSLLSRFAVNERRHLILENAIVMPFARLRLNKDDLTNLGSRMAARRGIDFTEIASVEGPS